MTTETKLMKVATLDSETFGLSINSVVWEVGIIQIECDEFYAPVSVSERVWQLDIFSQLAKGRVIEQQAVQMHKKFLGESFDSVILTQDFVSVPQFFSEFNEALKGTDEMWINHTSFDVKMLCSLAYDFGLSEVMPWSYRREYDIPTMLHKFVPRERYEAFKEGREPSQHRALGDCGYNLGILGLIGDRLSELRPAIKESES